MALSLLTLLLAGFRDNTTSVWGQSVAQSCPALCNPMDGSMPGSPVLRQLPELAQTHVHRVSDAIQPSHSLSFLSLPAFNLAQHQGHFQGVSSSHQVANGVSASVLPVNIQN